jgi:tetrapyrrole methylase family protein/MazG family protein
VSGRGKPSGRPELPDHGFSRLVSLMHRLRAPGGCPWDAEQTHESIKHYLVEEAYEAVEAIESGSERALCDELGDVLLQVLFHAEMAAERGAFSIDDVVAGLDGKLVRRHPHVFGDVVVSSSAEVVANWAKLKSEERRTHASPASEPASGLGHVPRALPALLRAHRLGQRAATVDFDWAAPAEVRAKVDEELHELDSALARADTAAAAAEIGDLLFTLASLSRHLGANAESLLQDTLERFQRRFRAMETELAKEGRSVEESTPEERHRAWTRAKAQEREGRG